MFDHLVKVNNLQPILKQYNITEGDLNFVKEQIAGPIDTEQCSSQMQTVSKHTVWLWDVIVQKPINHMPNYPNNQDTR